MISKQKILLLTFIPFVIYGQLFTVEYINNEVDEFLGV
jgi:hypothetical protein